MKEIDPGICAPDLECGEILESKELFQEQLGLGEQELGSFRIKNFHVSGTAGTWGISIYQVVVKLRFQENSAIRYHCRIEQDIGHNGSYLNTEEANFAFYWQALDWFVRKVEERRNQIWYFDLEYKLLYNSALRINKEQEKKIAELKGAYKLAQQELSYLRVEIDNLYNEDMFKKEREQRIAENQRFAKENEELRRTLRERRLDMISKLLEEFEEERRKELDLVMSDNIIPFPGGKDGGGAWIMKYPIGTNFSVRSLMNMNNPLMDVYTISDKSEKSIELFADLNEEMYIRVDPVRFCKVYQLVDLFYVPTEGEEG